jgi:hypothetical protein
VLDQENLTEELRGFQRRVLVGETITDELASEIDDAVNDFAATQDF